MYDITSSCADDFINHEEILDTLAYADQNKENSTLIDSIIQKAKKRKGLSHREASVLLACPIPEKNEEIFRLAEQIKKDFYVVSSFSYVLLRLRLLSAFARTAPVSQ